jgi:hypothetical protein
MRWPPGRLSRWRPLAFGLRAIGEDRRDEAQNSLINIKAADRNRGTHIVAKNICRASFIESVTLFRNESSYEGHHLFFAGEFNQRWL